MLLWPLFSAVLVFYQCIHVLTAVPLKPTTLSQWLNSAAACSFTCKSVILSQKRDAQIHRFWLLWRELQWLSNNQEGYRLITSVYITAMTTLTGFVPLNLNFWNSYFFFLTVLCAKETQGLTVGRGGERNSGYNWIKTWPRIEILW